MFATDWFSLEDHAMLPPVISHSIVEPYVDDNSPKIRDDKQVSMDDLELWLESLDLKTRRPEGAIVAHRMREQFTERATLALSRAAGGLNAPLVEKDRTDLGGDGERNRKAATVALKAIRLALYDRKYSYTAKSSNKWSLRHGQPSGKNMQGGATPPTLVVFENQPAKSAARSIDIWKSNYINCSALAAAVQDYLMHERPEVQTSSFHFGGMHAFALVGTVDQSFARRPFCQWPRHVHVCDPWANLTCQMPDYPKLFLEKMAKWESNGKKLHFDEQWVSPLDERWTSGVQSSRRVVLTRLHCSDGQFLETRLASN